MKETLLLTGGNRGIGLEPVRQHASPAGASTPVADNPGKPPNCRPWRRETRISTSISWM